jgi:NADH-quinone oxidoreductase subunit N
MVIYNLSLYLVFSTLCQFLSTDVSTLHSFSSLGMNNFYTKVLIIALFSMAGVPPFWGFFSKIFIFTLLCTSNFFILFPIFFSILFVGLYFYIQNIRFLNSTALSDFRPTYEFNTRNTPLYYYITFLVLFFLIFGVMFTEDLLLYVSWILF